MVDKQKIGKGGFRLGAGRKPKSGLKGDTSQVMRIPNSVSSAVIELLEKRRAIRIFSNTTRSQTAKLNPIKKYLPQLSRKIATRFLNPANDYIETSLDLNELLVKNSPATFFLDMVGHSMINAGIFDGDKIILDRSIEAKHGDIVVAIVNSEHTVKRLYKKNSKVELHAENPNSSIITFKNNEELKIVGVVTNTIHKVLND